MDHQAQTLKHFQPETIRYYINRFLNSPVIILDLKQYGSTVFHSQIISTNLPLPSHLSVIAEDLLLSSL